MDYRPLLAAEREELLNALRANSERGQALLMDRRNTRFLGTSDEVPEEEVIWAIQSVPCHY